MPSEKDNILKFNQYMKSDKMPFIIYSDLESIDVCPNNTEKSSATKLGEHVPCGYSMSTIGAFRLYKKVLSFSKKACYKYT